MEESEKLRRVVEARMKLKSRFEEKWKQSAQGPAREPMGSGKPNRHGMPQLPIGQVVTVKWPVLDLGVQPEIDPEYWSLSIDGAVEKPAILDWHEFMSFPQVDDVSDFHCVTTWSKFDLAWKGVRFIDLAAWVQPLETVTHVMCYAYDGYSTNIGLSETLRPDVLLVHTYEGKPLPAEHGGPVRMITPQLYAWKGAKWIRRIEFMTADRPGFWEERGYSDTANPWLNDRYR